jgi:hypothetical protein
MFILYIKKNKKYFNIFKKKKIFSGTLRNKQLTRPTVGLLQITMEEYQKVTVCFVHLSARVAWHGELNSDNQISMLVIPLNNILLSR